MMFGTQQVGGFEAARVICDTMPGEADSITSLAFDPFEVPRRKPPSPLEATDTQWR